jgi:hypothetical protein
MTKRNVAKTRARTKPHEEKPVDSEIQRAAKRAGIKVPPPGVGVALKVLTREQAAEHLCRVVGTKLVQISDTVAERIAAERSKQRWDGDYLRELEALLDLTWEIRWELCILPEDVRVEPKVLRKMAVAYEAAANTQPTDGAS